MQTRLTMTTDLISRARTGDSDAFRALTEPHRRELQVHCYRMLGSMQDAEDALQDTLLAAWRGLGGFDGRSSLRTWLYRIATNTCLNAIRMAKRRPARAWGLPTVTPPEPTRHGEVTWLEPFPDPLLEGAFDVPLGPEALYEQTESISLAFVAALQVLPPRQLAVLILRDVLGFRAAETADMLDMTLAGANSALARARQRLDEERDRWPAGERAAMEGDEDELAARFVRAYEAGDVAALVALFTDDVFLSMPPIPHEYRGREVVTEFFRRFADAGHLGGVRLVPTRANGRPAFGLYGPDQDGSAEARGLLAITTTVDGVCALIRFEPRVLASFGLPPQLPN
jgi:RNA polymerase sigma-70 factor (ECF subfamily)